MLVQLTSIDLRLRFVGPAALAEWLKSMHMLPNRPCLLVSGMGRFENFGLRQKLGPSRHIAFGIVPDRWHQSKIGRKRQ